MIFWGLKIFLGFGVCLNQRSFHSGGVSRGKFFGSGWWCLWQVQVTGDTRHVTCNTWHVTFGKWLMTFFSSSVCFFYLFLSIFCMWDLFVLTVICQFGYLLRSKINLQIRFSYNHKPNNYFKQKILSFWWWEKYLYIYIFPNEIY